MKGKRSWGRRLALSCALLVLVAAVPAFAAEVVQNGADLWHTTSGFTFTSFAENPIPADFFCQGSKPFKGTINMKGVPLATIPVGGLGETDTIVRRLDDATFNPQGETTTRIQLMALSLASVKPVDTGCGLYDVIASLAGGQPVTEMKIVRTSSYGGYYVAPLDLKVRLVFTPVSGKGDRREVANRVSLGPGSQSFWAYPTGIAKVAVKHTGTVKVDTNGDGVPDTLVPAPSNFLAGVDPHAVATATALCKDTSCHCAKWSKDPYTPNWYCDHLHCVEVYVDCDKPVDKVRYGPIPVDPSTPADPTPIGTVDSSHSNN